MKAAICLLFLAVIAIAAADTIPTDNCGDASDPLQLTSVSVSPFPLKAGANLTVSINGNLVTDVTGGSYSVNVKYMGIDLINQSGDLCTVDPKFPCPLTHGPFSITESNIALPSDAPAGQYDVTINATDKAGKRIACRHVQQTVGASKLSAPSDDKKCGFCEKAVTGVQALIKQKGVTADQITQFINGLCAKAGQYQQQCESATPAIVAALEGDATPEAVCQQVHLCAASEVMML